MKTTALIYLKKKNIINRIAVISILFIHFILFPSYSIQNLNHKTYSSQKDYYTVPLLFNSTSEHLDNFNYSEIISYNITNNLETTISDLESSISPPYRNIISSDDNLAFEINQETYVGKPQTIFGSDDRIRVTPTTSYPWRSIVKLYITFGGSIYIGSGMIIDETHVLTAGHCVYSHSHGAWADTIKVIPGMDDGNEPYGHAWAINMRTYKRWIDYQDHQHDFAVITLDSNIGQQTGWMGLLTTYSYDPIYTGGLNIAGYPGDLEAGLNMYFDYDTGRYANEYNHWYYMDTSGGMSGSPVWYYDGTNRYILSICTYGDDGSGSNHGTRIDRVKFDCIQNWLTADETSTDHPDMIDRDRIHSGFSPSTVGAGLTDFNVWCEIQNIGTVSTGDFTVSYYASLDAEIIQSDYFLGNDIVSSINPTDYIQSSWLGTFPSEMPSGSYYIGWIIDVNDAITEFKEGNNVGIMGSYKLLVDATPPSNPNICTQTNGSTTSDEWQDFVNDPDFTWSGASDSHTSVVGYYYYWGTNPLGTSSSYTTSQGCDPPKVSNGAYYLRIRTQDTVGNLAYWKTLYIFKYNDSINEDNEEPVVNNDNNKTSERDNDIKKNNEQIPGYEIYFLICVICVILVIQIKKFSIKLS